ncbi:hypothetical protein BaRGS_00004173 [Batillaria attramentaria]|uniref:Uncharacterized protein n=1 Tax=Batillaria attramentaria TaxID=370345 RepID=A0ABD0M0D5_9CAEN
MRQHSPDRQPMTIIQMKSALHADHTSSPSATYRRIRTQHVDRGGSVLDQAAPAVFISPPVSASRAPRIDPGGAIMAGIRPSPPSACQGGCAR